MLFGEFSGRRSDSQRMPGAPIFSAERTVRRPCRMTWTGQSPQATLT